MPPASRGARHPLPVAAGCLLLVLLCLASSVGLQKPESAHFEATLRRITHSTSRGNSRVLQSKLSSSSSQGDSPLVVETPSLFPPSSNHDTAAKSQSSQESFETSQRQKKTRRRLRGGSKRNPQLFPYMPALFAFGDSDFDAGNNLYLNLTTYKATKFAPYGDSYKAADPGKPLRGRFCDGLLIPDFLAEGLGLPILQPYFAPDAPFYGGASFAVSGSGLLNTTLNVYNPAVETHLFAQVQHFLDFQKAAVDYWAKQVDRPMGDPLYPEPSAFSEALYTVLVGGNDVLKFRTVQHGAPGPVADAFVKKMAATMQQVLQALYNAGARNFVVFSLGNVGCVPLARQLNNGSCSAAVTSICEALAESTANMPSRINESAPDASILIADLFGFTRAVEARPADFGISNTGDACCGGGLPGLGNTFTTCAADKPMTMHGVTYPKTVCQDPATYQYWDQFHLTQTMNHQLSHDVLRGASWVSPQNILEAFVVPRIRSGYSEEP